MNYPAAMERFLGVQGLPLKDFKNSRTQESQRVNQHAVEMCKRLNRPYEYLNHFTRKEDFAGEILVKIPVAEGLVCVLAATESSGSFKTVLWRRAPASCLRSTKVPVPVPALAPRRIPSFPDAMKQVGLKVNSKKEYALSNYGYGDISPTIVGSIGWRQVRRLRTAA